MTYWLIVFLFTNEGEFVAKDVYETTSNAQCIEFSGQVAQTLVNTKMQAQFHCVSDDEYMGRSVD